MQITHISCGSSHCFAFSSITGRLFGWGTNYCGELGNGTFDSVNEPTEIQVPAGQKFVDIVAGNAFTIGLTVPHTWSSQSHVIDELHFDDDDDFSTVVPSRFAANTVEIVTPHEKAHAVNSPLNSTGVKLAPQFSFNTESIRRIENSSQISFSNPSNTSNTSSENDLIFQNRAARAAALEKQFQSILRH